jgi:heptosyltransferase-3
MASRILISRTDRLGDVVLTLPIAGYLKSVLPNSTIGFLCTEYTKSIVERSKYIDEIVIWDHLQSSDLSEQIKVFQRFDCIVHVYPNKKVAWLAKKARVPLRIGTSHRVYHWLTCNKLVNLNRKTSPYHEAQINFILFKHFGLKVIPDLKEIANYYGINPFVGEQFSAQYPKDKINIALHPKSGGSAREWNIENFDALIKLLDLKKYRIFITGSDSERSGIEPLLKKNPLVIDMVGKFSLDKFIEFLSSVDIFVAASTGPLHVSASLGKATIGLFPPVRPMFTLKWGPVGSRSSSLVVGNNNCEKCRKTKTCECVNDITPDMVLNKIESQIQK